LAQLWVDYKSDSTNLKKLWVNYREEPEKFEKFFEYNNIGLPLTSWIAQGLISELTPKGVEFVNETFAQLLEVAGMTEENFEVLPERNIGAVIVFSTMRRKFKSEGN